MTPKEQLVYELETLPDALVHEALDLICQLKQRRSLSRVPSSDLWQLWWEQIDGVTDDFMGERSQPQAQPREDIFP
ncbi:MAG TPA: AbrB/MazE/SpoVT family DNA-binding domain-containing protein [Oscillatoriaceae cyanobacterium M33_DOE_052]|uniref:AbrB/MazE/SpoVT family DNA-binding domain-containing protein n=1 Tax=Planktothricoides sp. SpSt-374 TaxID=2282167 RepID=A0A7C3VPH0_9CYAN|nr:AbrB/MazE/SpoVT family DNA-binding domain-containing protein [Oscillatoriaceae cyanobacterium M33_DOE_052]